MSEHNKTNISIPTTLSSAVFTLPELNLIPYKNSSKTLIKKYHVVDTKNKIIKYKICGIFAPFGREAEYSKFNSLQQRFNVCFTREHINNKIKPYVDFMGIINAYEQYFKNFDELAEYNLNSNIINRDNYGIVVRCHLKTHKDKTTSTLKKFNLTENKFNNVEWIDFDKNEHFDMEYYFDCLWIDDINKKFGISIKVDNIYQF
jgi:hypothetical protein